MNAAAVSAVFKERIASHAEHVKKVAHIISILLLPFVPLKKTA